jgi:hypothetical protein
LPCKQQVHLLFREVLQLLVVVEEARSGVGALFPDKSKSLKEGAVQVPFFAPCDEVARCHADLLAETAALGTHALRVVERKRVRIAGVRLADA